MTAATLALLETTIERYGRDAVTDPVALEGALRAATVAPPERQIAALVEAAASGAVGRLRSELDGGASAVAALESVAGDDGAARWAVATTGAALGFLPRALALATTPPAADDAEAPDDPAAAGTEVEQPATAPIATTAPANAPGTTAPANTPGTAAPTRSPGTAALANAAGTGAPANAAPAEAAAGAPDRDAVGPAEPTVLLGAAAGAGTTGRAATPTRSSAPDAVGPTDPTVVLGPDAGTSARTAASSDSDAAAGRAGAVRPADPTVDLAGPTTPGRAASTSDVGPADPTVDADPAAPTVDADTSGIRQPYRRRRVLIAGLGVAVLVVAVVVAGVLLTRPPAASVPMDAMPPPSGLAAPTPEPAAGPDPGTAPSATPDPAAPPADPHAAFRDPGLLALAEPYLAAEPGAVCRAGQPSVNVQEKVSCAFPSGHAGLFTKLLGVDVMRDLRAGLLEGTFSAPGTTRSLRWKDVAGRPGVRTGIPADRSDPGEGVRIRFVDAEYGDPRLYFDRDSCACAAYLGLAEASGDDRADLDELRAFWANPAR